MEICYRAIGTIHSPFQSTIGMPVQPTGASGQRGHLDLQAEFAAGLQDLEGFSHLILLYHFHQVEGVQLTVTPFLDAQPHGLFATRAPKRPNPIGLSIVKLLSRDGCRLQVENIDVLDGTPLLDLKPYVPEFDSYPQARAGWLEAARGQVEHQRSDDRFR
ncbi:MAG: tRNA (N6-threonylcarbamoyladenosine(37)-N6)-methyltransferase TrmO [Spirulinaceae cyanobacterium RM2_2_10]|nr:tRNA (N6-threonylcarbamoyladenosine(37)-N6)-methyltransferase TrmO [Spirulinaceae cyanobacterium SM2_1_0]NJO20783.1 tRNA (N6-threonylcarbamoyladenosine(37)-N6)-methyltransferase TrmO [Spirulinaceae cyanobacterium RM2_2_10]